MVEEKIRAVKQTEWSAERPVRPHTNGHDRIVGNVEQSLAVGGPSGEYAASSRDQDSVLSTGVGLTVNLASARLVGRVGDPVRSALRPRRKLALRFVEWRDPERRCLSVRR